MMDNALKTSRSAREWTDKGCLKPFRENPPRAVCDDAAEPAGTDRDADTPPLRWQIGQ